jgi:hypothetical protein
MPKFTVCVREVWIQMVAVEAPDEANAKERVADGQGTYLGAPGGLEYSHTLDRETWTVDAEADPKETTRRIQPPNP